MFAYVILGVVLLAIALLYVNHTYEVLKDIVYEQAEEYIDDEVERRIKSTKVDWSLDIYTDVIDEMG